MLGFIRTVFFVIGSVLMEAKRVLMKGKGVFDSFFSSPGFPIFIQAHALKTLLYLGFFFFEGLVKKKERKKAIKKALRKVNSLI
jgi:hypothetical protein